MSTPEIDTASDSLSDRWSMRGLRSKLLLGFGGMLLVLLAVSLLAHRVLLRYSVASQRMLRDDLGSVQAVQDMRDALVGIEADVHGLLHGKGVAVAASIAEHERDFERALAIQNTSATLPQEPEVTRRLAGRWAQYHRSLDQLQNPALTEVQRRAFYDEVLTPMAFTIREDARDISRLNLDSIRASESRGQSMARGARMAMHVLTACGVGVALLFALLIGRIILRPVQLLTASAQAIQGGNLDLAVPVRSRDELGRLGEAFNAMAAQLREFRRIDHEKLLRTQRTTQLAIDSLPDAVVVIQPDGLIELANQTARRLFHLQPGLHVRQVTTLPAGRLADLHRRATQEGQLPQVVGYTAAVQINDAGQDRFFLPRAVTILDEDQRPIGLTVVLADVTDFRRLDKIKDGLLSLVSHELKTPLTSLRIVLPLLADGKMGVLTAQQQELLIVARDESERLHHIVENLLDIGRLEAGKGLSGVRPVAVTELLEQSIAPFRALLRERGIALEVSIAPNESTPGEGAVVLADAMRATHVFANLLANAARYTPAGGHVCVTATQRCNEVEFSVADSGPGIAPQHLQRIFEKFYRVPGQPGDTGSGLGLAIVKDIVEAHGGHISVESPPGAGAIFRFTFPSPPYPSATPCLPAPPTSPSRTAQAPSAPREHPSLTVAAR